MISHKFYSVLPEEAKIIRNEVFVEEQGFRDEFDDNDKKCLHIVLFDGDTPIATGRIFPENGRGNTYIAGRIAVRNSYRGKNVGAEVMKLLESKAKELGAEILAVSAQCRAQGFYEKMGYTANGDIYLDEHCEHIH
nr:GNAT family N-acetyltransferase [Oscillospiraceae bacterium]